MITKVISGGQTGADQAGLRAAKKAGIPTGGYMPWAFLTEEGYKPEMATEFDMIELDDPTYPPRTEENIRKCTALVWFGNTKSPGGKLTLRLAEIYRKDTFSFRGSRDATKASPSNVVTWIRAMGSEKDIILNVAGNRESTHLGTGKWVEEFLDEVFRLLKKDK